MHTYPMLSMSSLHADIKQKITLLDTQVSIDRSVPGSACQVLALSVWNVLSVSLDVPLGKSEVENEDLVAGFVQTDAEVIGLDVAVDEVSVVDVLDSLDHLVDQHEDGLQRELSQCLVEQSFQRVTHQIHNQNIIVT